jgi:hypothetical protein
MAQLPYSAERDLDEHPYSPDEQRVVDFLYERGAGGGADPIGFLLASYSYVVAERNEMRSCLAQGQSHFEHTEAGVIDWKMEVERLNQIIAAYEKRHPEIGWPTQEEIKEAPDAQDDPVSSTNNPSSNIAGPEDAESGGNEVASQTNSLGMDGCADRKR